MAQTSGTSPDDASIQEEMEAEIAQQLYLEPDIVTAEVENGDLTLRGSVPTLADRNRLYQIASATRGVQSIDNQLLVVPMDPIGDEQIIANIKQALFLNPATESYEVSILSNEGRVTLSGTVESYQEKDLAMKIASSIEGVKQIENDLEIDIPAERTDLEIEEDVRGLLAWDSTIDAADINVRSLHGKVYLIGTVSSLLEKNLARLSSWVVGVHDVDASGLRVDPLREHNFEALPLVDRSDENLVDAINQRFLQMPEVALENITIQANEGVVTLRGSVRNLHVRDEAVRAARSILGVEKIRNRLSVATTTQSNPELKSIIEDSLRQKGLSTFEDVSVEVIGNTAYLEGKVNSPLAYRTASDITRQTPGVAQVENELRVDNTDNKKFSVNWKWIQPMPNRWGYFNETIHDLQDAALASAVKENLSEDPWVSPSDIQVRADSGIVYLSGDIRSFKQKDAAIEAAFDAGARWVVTQNLEIVSPS